MTRHHCRVPLCVRVRGELADTQLQAIGAAIATAVAGRLQAADGAIAARSGWTSWERRPAPPQIRFAGEALDDEMRHRLAAAIESGIARALSTRQEAPAAALRPASPFVLVDYRQADLPWARHAPAASTGVDAAPAPGSGAYIASLGISMVRSDRSTHWNSAAERRATILDYLSFTRDRPALKRLHDEALAAYPDLAAMAVDEPDRDRMFKDPALQEAMTAALRSAPTPTVRAGNELIEAVAVFLAIRPAPVGRDGYEGVHLGQRFTLDEAAYAQLRDRVREQIANAIRYADSRAEMAIGRYEEQQKVDANHWLTAPIIKTLAKLGHHVADPGPLLVQFADKARAKLLAARTSLRSDDFAGAALLAGQGEALAQQAARMVLAYVDQIIDAGEMTVTVLEGVKWTAGFVLFLCAVAATGGIAGAGATQLGLTGAGGTTTLLGLTGGTATWATVIGAGAAITEEVGVALVDVADGEAVDWVAVAGHAAVQVVLARFSPTLGRRLSLALADGLAASRIAPLVARLGTARVVTVATNFLLHEGTQFFATTIEDVLKLLSGRPVTWAQFGQVLFARLTDPQGLLMNMLGSLLGAMQPEPSQRPGGPRRPAGAKLPKSPTDNKDMRAINRELGLPKPRKPGPPILPPPGHVQLAPEDVFLPTPAERAAAYAEEDANRTLLTDEFKPIRRSATASPRGGEFEAARASTRRAGKTAINADQGENMAFQGAVRQGEIALESPQGVNVNGRPDFITAARDPDGKMWIIETDAKTTSSVESSRPGARPRFPEPELVSPETWAARVKAAVERMSLGDAALEAEIIEAYRAGRIWKRQANVDLSRQGQGAISGLVSPPSRPWGALLGPMDFKVPEDDGKKPAE